ncbi:MAG TPA: alpha/beta hydrolase, partial [Glaciihabitans sp.]|nr:alpha/beta hydrolase [Glaciihabitans sp.]
VGNLMLIAGWLDASPRLRLLTDTWQQLSIAAPHTLSAVGAFASFSPAYLDAHPAAAHTPPLQPSPTTTRQMQLANTVDLDAVASALTIPTLVISGTHDDVASREQGRALFAAIPTARYTEVDSGHAMLRERPAEILALISAFVADPARYPAGAILPAAIV